MVDRHVGEKKRAEEYSVLAAGAVKVVQDRLKQKGLTEDGGMINPARSHVLNFEMSVDHETGVTTFGLSFTEAFEEKSMAYRFKDGKVKKGGHTYTDMRSVSDGERYYGEFTEEEKDYLAGEDSDDPEALPRDDVFFADSLRVGLRELRLISQIIDLLGTNPKKADELARELPWFD